MTRVPELGQIIATRHHLNRVLVGIVTKLHPCEQFTVQWEPWAASSYFKRYPFRSFASFTVRGKVEADVAEG